MNLLAPRDHRGVDPQDVLDIDPSLAGHPDWPEFLRRNAEAKRAPPVVAAREMLHTAPQFWFTRPMFIAVGVMGNDQLTELVQRAEEDYAVHDYLRAWLAGELTFAVPDQLPPALTPFVRRLAAQSGPAGRGKGRKAPAPPATLLRACAAHLQALYGCPRYRSSSDDQSGTACDYISQALEGTPSPLTVMRYIKGCK